MANNLLKQARRPAVLMMEVTVAVAIVGVLAVIVAQCLSWSLSERARLATHQAALELAANILEAARAEPWDKLDDAWAKSQVVPTEMADLLPDGKVQVTLEPWPAESGARRLTVVVSWRMESYSGGHSVQLTTVISGRSAKIAGGKP
jgi:type II secretory pathway pseudopilin PulG